MRNRGSAGIGWLCSVGRTPVEGATKALKCPCVENVSHAIVRRAYCGGFWDGVTDCCRHKLLIYLVFKVLDVI